MRHLRALVAAICLSLLPFQALALECGKAATPVEKRICSSSVLQQLDASLMQEYPSYVKRNGAERAAQMQRAWLLAERNMCEIKTFPEACLEAAYMNRIMELTRAERVFVFTEASPEWDFVVRASVCGTKDYSKDCEGPGAVDIFAKGSGRLAQHIEMAGSHLVREDMEDFYTEGLYIEIDVDNQPTVNRNLIYGEYNSGLVLKDYNFDGHADMALRNGNNASYWGPSYDIFLFDPAKKQFVFNEALSTLAVESLGLLEVSEENKQLVTFDKNGCCWHQISFYEMTGNTPVLVRDVIEDGTVEDEFMVITEKRLVDGQWETTVTREPIELYDR